jgi:hypothetical protein
MAVLRKSPLRRASSLVLIAIIGLTLSQAPHGAMAQSADSLDEALNAGSRYFPEETISAPTSASVYFEGGYQTRCFVNHLDSSTVTLANGGTTTQVASAVFLGLRTKAGLYLYRPVERKFILLDDQRAISHFEDKLTRQCNAIDWSELLRRVAPHQPEQSIAAQQSDRPTVQRTRAAYDGGYSPYDGRYSSSWGTRRGGGFRSGAGFRRAPATYDSSESRRGIAPSVPLSPSNDSQSMCDRSYFMFRAIARADRLLNHDAAAPDAMKIIAYASNEVSTLQYTLHEKAASIDPLLLTLVDDVAKLGKDYEAYLVKWKEADGITADSMRSEEDKTSAKFGKAAVTFGAVQGIHYVADHAIGAAIAGQTAAAGGTAAGGAAAGGAAAAGAAALPVAVVCFVGGILIKSKLDEMETVHLENLAHDARERTRFAAFQEYEASVDRVEDSYRTIAQALAQKYGWSTTEAQFDLTPQEHAEYRAATSIDALRTVLQKMRGQAPRDPFVRLEYGSCRGRQLLDECRKNGPTELIGKNISEVWSIVDSLQDAADFVPRDADFNSNRAMFLAEAGDLANQCLEISNRAAGHGCYGRPQVRAAVAMRLWNSCLANTEDVNGQMTMRLGFATGFSGDLESAHRICKSVATKRMSAKCPIFAHHFAAICSRLGRADQAHFWIRFAVKECGSALSDFVNDPDFGKTYEEAQ